MRLSYRKLTTFGDCPLHYRYAYIEKVSRPPVSGLAFQRRLHRALRRFHQYQQNDGLVPVGQLLAAWQSIWDEDEVPNFLAHHDFQEGCTILRAYAERENQLQRVTAEVETEIIVAFGPFTLTGRIDRLDFAEDGGYSVVDYKLDRQLPEGNSAQENRQLAFYAFLVEQGPGLPVRDVRLYYLRHSAEHVHLVSSRELHDTLIWVETTAAAIRRERAWQPVEGSHCRVCPYHRECPLKTGKARPLQEAVQQMDIYDLEETEV